MLWMTWAMAVHAERTCAGDDCELFAHEETLRVPADGAQDVATTAQPVVARVVAAGFFDLNTGGWIDGVLERVVGHPSLSRVKPDIELPADSTIELWTVDTEGSMQALLGTFETGSGPDTEVPPVPTGLFADAENRSRDGCVEGTAAVSAGWDAVVDPQGGVIYEVRFVHPEREEVMGIDALFAEVTTYGSCGPVIPEMGVGDVVEVDVRAVDLSGNASEWSSAVQTVVPGRGCGCSSGPEPAWVGIAGLGAWAMLLLGRTRRDR